LTPPPIWWHEQHHERRTHRIRCRDARRPDVTRALLDGAAASQDIGIGAIWIV
jgi:hypothetical protein